MTDEEAIAAEKAAGWHYVVTDGIYLNPQLTDDLTEAAKSLRVALAPVDVLQFDNTSFSGLLFPMLSALTAQRALLARVFPDTQFEIIRWISGDWGHRHRCTWRPVGATLAQQEAWEKEIRW